MTQTANAAVELAREHDEVDRLAIRIATLGPGPERTTRVHELCARFVIHVQAEERYLYPVVRRWLPDGALLAAAQASSDRAAARTVEQVERGDARDDEFDILVAHLLVSVHHHVELQDAVLLPGLIRMCPIKESGRLGEQLRKGVLAARQAAERAGMHACEHSERAVRDGMATRDAVDGESRCRGFRALLQRMARGGATLDAAR